MASAGSRTVTAGSEFHRPRSTLNNANQYAMTAIPRGSGLTGRAAPAGERIHGHRGEQHNRSPDVLRGRRESEQQQAVVDHADYQTTEHGAEQAGAADDRRRDGVEHIRAALEVA